MPKFYWEIDIGATARFANGGPQLSSIFLSLLEHKNSFIWNIYRQVLCATKTIVLL